MSALSDVLGGTGSLKQNLSLGTKVSYGLGDFASNMSWALVQSFLLLFLTDVAVLPMAFISVLLLMARIWDGVNDGLMGLIMDRTSSKYGRFRPYLLYGPPFLALFNILTFTVAPDNDVVVKMIWVTIAYVCLDMAYTAVNIPYGAMTAVMTQDSDERSTLSSFRMFFAMLGSIILAVAAMPVIQALGGGNMQKGFFLAACLFSIGSMPLFWITFAKCKEIVAPPKEQKITLADSFRCIYQNKQLLVLMLSVVFGTTATFGRMGVAVYYYIYTLKRPDLIPMFMMTGSVILIGVILSTPISLRIGKRNTALIAMAGGVVTLIGLYLTPFTSIPMVFLWLAANSLFGGIGMVMTFSMLPDCIEYAEWKTGTRADGMVYATGNLVAKLGTAIGGAASAAVLAAIGYVPNAVQTPETVQGINMLVNLAPAVLNLMAMVPLFFYGIDSKSYANMMKEIAERRSAA